MTLWLISDTHFGHANIIKYSSRPFTSVEEMDEYMVDQWNKVVRVGDHVYHLGDVAMTRPALQIVKRLNGQKRLVFGNHDIYDYKSYTEVGFKKLMGMRVISNVILTHVPIHPQSLKEQWTGNIHGHIHERDSFGQRYLNVSVEQTGYAPLSLEDAIGRLKAQGVTHLSADSLASERPGQ